MNQRLGVLLVLLLVACPSPVRAQRSFINIASSPNPVGSGARALGMGGAFIGVADDATAASWNPGGLIQLETPEISVAGTFNRRREDTDYAAFPEASGPQSIDTWDLNYFSLAYPFRAFDRNMIVSLNYQHLYDFNRKVSYSYTLTHPGPPVLLTNDEMTFSQDGALRALAPAFAVQILPQLSLGLTLNIWDKNLCGWESTYLSTGTGKLQVGLLEFPFSQHTEIREKFDFKGYNLNLGFLWNVNGVLTLGGVFKAPFRAGLDHNYNFAFDRNFTPPVGPGADQHERIDISDGQKLDMPMSYGLGIAVRLGDALTVDLDVYRTQWDDFVRRGSDGREYNPVTGRETAVSECKPTTQVRLGSEYLFIENNYVVPIRAGVFYDPEPSENNPDDFYGFSLGSGIAYKQFVYDIAYQYRFGRDVRTVIVGNENSSQDVDQNTVVMSLIYHF